jgi:hypothetical protein
MMAWVGGVVEGARHQCAHLIQVWVAVRRGRYGVAPSVGATWGVYAYRALTNGLRFGYHAVSRVWMQHDVWQILSDPYPSKNFWGVVWGLGRASWRGRRLVVPVLV